MFLKNRLENDKPFHVIFISSFPKTNSQNVSAFKVENFTFTCVTSIFPFYKSLFWKFITYVYLPPGNEVLGKVMFYTCLSVILFTGGVCLWVGVSTSGSRGCTSPGHTPWTHTNFDTHTPGHPLNTHTPDTDTHTPPPDCPGHTHPLDITPSRDGYWSGWYLFNWNAFLFSLRW